jgi:hypothetical protein
MREKLMICAKMKRVPKMSALCAVEYIQLIFVACVENLTTQGSRSTVALYVQDQIKLNAVQQTLWEISNAISMHKYFKCDFYAEYNFALN